MHLPSQLYITLRLLRFYLSMLTTLILEYFLHKGHITSIYDLYLGIDMSPTSLPKWSTLLFLLIFIMYKHITPNTIYYHSHTLSLMMYTFSFMYTAWCLTLYHNPIYCWALSIYNYCNLLPIPL